MALAKFDLLGKPIEEVRAMFIKKQEEKAALEDKLAPLRRERQRLLDQIQPLELQLRAVDAEIQAETRSKMVEIDYDLALLARAITPVPA